MMTKRIGILGSGQVGQALARGFARHGWDVMIGSRSPDSANLKAWRGSAGPRSRTGTFAETAAFGEVVLLATLGAATDRVLELAGPSNFRGKLVLDAMNPIDYPGGEPYGLFLGTKDSLGEHVQRALPDAHVVKCFNAVNNSQMIDPKFREGTPPMFICGNDPGAKERTEAIVRELGWPGVFDIGGIDAARWLEALVPLFIRAAKVLDTVRHAIKVVT
jgi:hypothetical protein